MASHVYHWRHGWIPMDRTAAIRKAGGDEHLATSMLAAARGESAGINSRRDVAHAISELHTVPERYRIGPRQQIIAAAKRHHMEHLLPLGS